MKISNLLKLAKSPEGKELFNELSTCQKCLYYKTQKCNYAHRSDVIFPTDLACPDGFLAIFIGADVILKRGDVQTIKPVRFLSSTKTKNELLHTFELDNEELEELIIKIKQRHTYRKQGKEEPEATETKSQEEIYPELKEKAMELLKQPNLVERFISHSDKWLVLDQPTRKAELLVSVSTLSEFPLNLSLLQMWSTGKTTITVNTCRYFEGAYDVWTLGYMSPKVLIHQHGEQDKQKGSVINLQFKIIAFLEEPSLETLSMLKPLLSHDKFETTYKYVDRETGKTVTATLRGWPSTFFCAVKSRHTEEFTSRWLTASPQISQDKIRKVLQQKADRAAHPEKFEIDEEFKIWQKAFAILKESAPYKVVIPYAPTLEQHFRAKKSVDMRYFELFLAMNKASTILHSLQRTKDENGRLTATLQDYEVAYNVFKHIEKPTVYGLGQNVLDFYANVLLPLATSENAYTDYETLLSKYTETFGEATTRDNLRETYLKPLEKKGLINTEPDPNDKRKTIIFSSGALPETSLIDNDGFTKAMNEQQQQKIN